MLTAFLFALATITAVESAPVKLADNFPGIKNDITMVSDTKMVSDLADFSGSRLKSRVVSSRILGELQQTNRKIRVVNFHKKDMYGNVSRAIRNRLQGVAAMRY